MIFIISRVMRSLTVLVVTFFGAIENLVRVSFMGGRGIDLVFREWAKEVMNLARAEVLVEGTEFLSEQRGLFLFHHASLLDIPTMYVALPTRQIRFGAKSELFNIPVFGRSIRAAGTLPIARGEPKTVRKLYEEVAKNRPDGIDFALAAEGTRQEKNQIGNLKTGPFVFAISAQMPIYPVIITRANEILSKTDWIFQADGVKVIVKILPPIDTKGLTMDDRLKLKEQVREQMVRGLNELISKSDLGHSTVALPPKTSQPRLPH